MGASRGRAGSTEGRHSANGAAAGVAHGRGWPRGEAWHGVGGCEGGGASGEGGGASGEDCGGGGECATAAAAMGWAKR